MFVSIPAGDFSLLVRCLAIALRRSLLLAIRAGRGEPIAEPGDLDKEVAIFVRNQRGKGEGVPSSQTRSAFLKESVGPLLSKVEEKLRQLSPLFERIELFLDGPGEKSRVAIDRLEFVQFEAFASGDLCRIHFQFEKYLPGAVFSHETVLELRLLPTAFVLLHDGAELLSRSYSVPIYSEEALRISDQILAALFGQIKALAGVA